MFFKGFFHYVSRRKEAKMRFSILLVSWNAIDDTRRFLESLKAQTFKDFEAILVDNGSEDGSIEMARTDFPFVDLIELGENSGFAHANNVAAELAAGDLLFIVNTDTKLPPNCLEVLDAVAKRERDFDIFSCQMLSMDARDTVDCKGMTFTKSLRARMIGIAERVDAGEPACEIFGATGGAMLIRRYVYERIGLFDDAFFFNNEDVDFALRARGAGFRTLYVPDVVVYHRRSPNEARYPDMVLYHIQRNLVLAALKNIPFSLWLRYGPAHLAYNAFQILKWSGRGKGRIVLRAKLDAIRMAMRLGRKPLPADNLREWIGRIRGGKVKEEQN